MGIRVREWLEYGLIMGFEHFYVYGMWFVVTFAIILEFPLKFRLKFRCCF